jgi:hypothetical protein
MGAAVQQGSGQQGMEQQDAGQQQTVQHDTARQTTGQQTTGQQTTGQQDRPAWRVVLRPRWLAWHAFAAAAFVGMLWLGDWQLHRALSGNELSWAYTFEWPLFAVAGAYFWVRTLREELHLHQAGAEAADGDGAESAAAEGTDSASSHGGAAVARSGEDEQAAAEEYAARLKAEVSRHGKWHGWR